MSTFKQRSEQRRDLVVLHEWLVIAPSESPLCDFVGAFYIFYGGEYLETQGWENIYRIQGEVQTEVLQVVKDASQLFKDKGIIRILELGCGTGRHTIYLAQQNFNVYSTDISETGIEINKKKAESLSLNNIIYKQHDMVSIPFEDNKFDAVLCIWTTGHGLLHEVSKNIEEMYRIIKPGGMVVADYVSIEDETFGLGTEIEPNTFIGSRPGEEDISHHYSAKEELRDQYERFSIVNIKNIEYILSIDSGIHTIKGFLIEAIK